MDYSPELEKMKKALMGDVEAFSFLVRTYSGAVFTAAFQHVRDFHHAQDIAQEAFIRAWHSRGYIKDADKVGRWLYTTTKRLSIDWIRKNSKHHSWSQHDFDVMEVPESRTTEEQFIQMEQKLMVWDAMRRLKDNDRTVILMYYMSGFNTREIARFLGVSSNTIESRLRRTRDKLKEELFELVGDVFRNQGLMNKDTEQVTTINLSFALGSSYIDLFNEHIVRNFEKANPTIRVNVTSYDLCELPQLNYEEELIRMIASGTQPDVAFFDPGHIASWVEQERIHPVSSFIKEAGVESGRFYNHAWESCMYKGEMYGLPWNMSNTALFYNKALMRAVGLDPEQPPITIEQLDQMAELMFKEYTSGGYSHVGFIPWFSAGNLFTSSLIWGGDWERDGKLTPGDPRIIESLAWMKRYGEQYDQDKLAVFMEQIHAEPNLYERMGFVFLGCWDMWNIYPRYMNAGDEWGIAPLPTVKGTQQVTPQGGFSFVIPKGAAHVREAWEFIQYAAYGEGLEHWIKVDPESNLAAMPEMNPKLPLANDSKFQVYLESVPAGKRRPVSPLSPYMWSELSRVTDTVLNGQGDPKELLEQLQANIEERVIR